MLYDALMMLGSSKLQLPGSQEVMRVNNGYTYNQSIFHFQYSGQ